MKNIKLTQKKRGIEVCIMTLSAETNGGKTITRDLDFGGNSIPAVVYGAQRAIQVLNEMENEDGRGTSEGNSTKA